MKWVKRILIGLLVLMVLGVGFLGVFFFLLHPKSRDAPTVTAPTTPEAIARGEYLAKHVAGCVVCHSPMDEKIPGDYVEESRLLNDAGMAQLDAGLQVLGLRHVPSRCNFVLS